MTYRNRNSLWSQNPHVPVMCSGWRGRESSRHTSYGCLCGTSLVPLSPALGLHFRLASVNHFETLCLHLIALPEEERRNHSLFIQQISIKHLQHIRIILETGVTKPLPSWNFLWYWWTKVDSSVSLCVLLRVTCIYYIRMQCLDFSIPKIWKIRAIFLDDKIY